jgi:hypothetical protein
MMSHCYPVVIKDDNISAACLIQKGFPRRM